MTEHFIYSVLDILVQQLNCFIYIVLKLVKLWVYQLLGPLWVDCLVVEGVVPMGDVERCLQSVYSLLPYNFIHCFFNNSKNLPFNSNFHILNLILNIILDLFTFMNRSMIRAFSSPLLCDKFINLLKHLFFNIY